ncbi:hypothetical protein ACE6H2_025940 [Prunus campanulata]
MEQTPINEDSPSVSKKAAMKQEKLRRRQEQQALAAASRSLAVDDELDQLAANYGEFPLQSKTVENVSRRTQVASLTNALENCSVRIRGKAHTIRVVGKNMAFVVVRESWFTVQCVATVQPDTVSRQMVKYVAGLSRESVIDVEGLVSIPSVEIKGTTQQVEVQVRKLYCVSRAPELSFNIEDAARSDAEIEIALQAGEKLVRVNQDTRLNNRDLDLRTQANQGIFSIQSEVGNIFRGFLLSEGFREIHTPKLIAGSSEGGAAVFTLDYKGQPACLAQSPQLYKQMASVMDIVARLFVTIFGTLNKTCQKELEAVGRQYPFEPLKYLPETLRLTFEEGVQMLKDAGDEVDTMGDLNTEAERKLGQLVLEKYGTEFYILHRYPLAVRPFYTMPCHDNPAYSNSFDVFIRGEEIISGAQREHRPELLEKRAQACGIELKTISTCIDAIRNGVTLHGGFGAGLERVVMLFLGLDNIRKTSLFPRDPRRLAP